MTERDNRNQLAWGKGNQQKLYDSRILVVGSDVLSQLVLVGLAGLSVGNIYFMDNKRISKDDRDFLCIHDREKIGKKKVRYIEDILHKINGDINVLGIYSKFAEAFVFNYKPEIIVDGTNDSISKESALRYALNYNIPFISASSDNGKAAIALYFPRKNKIGGFSERPNLEILLMHEFENSRQEGFTSGVIAGLLCEEVRKIKFKYSDDGIDDNLSNNTKLIYNLYSDSRRDIESTNGYKPVYFKGKIVLIAGAGAIGNFVALNLALLGVGKIDILDFDDIEDNNLNRQILFYDRIGQKKSDVIVERIREIDPFIQSNSIYAKIGEIKLDRDKLWLMELYCIERKLWEKKLIDKREKTFPDFNNFIENNYKLKNNQRDLELITEQRVAKENYDIIFGCLDNKFARLWLNNFAVNYNTPYIDGGTSYKSGQMAVYVPGKTKCINCQIDLMHFPPPRSCAEGPEGSVVMSNMIIGSAMVGEAIRAMYSIGNPILSDFRYKAMDSQRFYLRPKKNTTKIHNC